jgi:hypothetical protein
MPAISMPSRRACGFGFALAVCASCATYVDEPPLHDSTGATGGSSGDGGAPVTAGSSAQHEAGKAGLGTSGGGRGGAGGAGGGTESGAGGSGGAAGSTSSGAGGGGSGGAAGKAGAGGGGGTGGKASGGAGGSSGSGGSGGQGPTCAKNPISAKSSWTVTASHSQANSVDPVGNTKDGVLTNRWTTGKDQSGDEWLQVDFGVAVKLSKITLVLGASSNDYPRKFAARLSGTSQNFAAPVLDSGMGAQSTDTVIDLPADSVGRYLLISQGGTATALWWSVAEIQAVCAD